MSLRASLGAASFALSLSAIVAGCGAPQRPDGGSGLLTVGAQVPDLRAVDQTGAARSIAGERGHVLVVYFYPKDETPGCTKEACAFRDSWTKLSEGGVMVYGVSADDAASHAAFAKKYSLPFPLIADTDQAWAKAFGVGSTLGMYKRISFLIGPDGKIAKVYPDVNPAMHADEVLADALVLPKLRSYGTGSVSLFACVQTGSQSGPLGRLVVYVG